MIISIMHVVRGGPLIAVALVGRKVRGDESDLRAGNGEAQLNRSLVADVGDDEVETN